MIKQKNNSFPHYFIVFFVILIILDSVFVYLATSTHRGVVTENAYNQGLNYNKIIEASKKQNDLNWKSEIIYQDDFLNFYLENEKKDSFDGASVTAFLVRPTQTGYDFSIKLEKQRNGKFQKLIKFPLKGQWDVKILVIWNKHKYQTIKRILIK